MKIALVHDFLDQYGGAERVLEAIHELFPYAHVYTSRHDPTKMPLRMRNWDIRPFKLPKIPLAHFLKYYTAFYPFLFENLDLREYDLVISSTAFFAKGILVKPGAVHISYIHTPPRFLYHYAAATGKRELFFYRPVLAILDNFLRIWDYQAAQRPDFILVNSQEVARRVKKFYGREATVIHPPVELPNQPINKLTNQPTDQFYYLVVSRLLGYKRIDLAVGAANALKVPLKIVGTGREETRLKRMAGPTIEFLGFLSDEKVSELYFGCQALIFPTDEDFGIVPVEAMSFGKPVIAFAKGGAKETIVAGKTGEFFSEPTVASLVEVWRDFESSRYKAKDCIAQAKQFSKARFLKEFYNFIGSKIDHA
ncbi:MAG TPA: glycosyltransferase [Patescibacteria group bacterium]|nr:glycosyltransferase [Patescibacteria group bacterium]